MGVWWSVNEMGGVVVDVEVEEEEEEEEDEGDAAQEAAESGKVSTDRFDVGEVRRESARGVSCCVIV